MSGKTRLWIYAQTALLCAALGNCSTLAATNLPARYFELLNAGIVGVEQRLDAEPNSDLAALEAKDGWKHFPSAALVAAVLYTKENPANPRRGDAKLLALAERIGDLLSKEHAAGRYTTRL